MTSTLIFSLTSDRALLDEGQAGRKPVGRLVATRPGDAIRVCSRENIFTVLFTRAAAPAAP
jgi:hypothetical protein